MENLKSIDGALEKLGESLQTGENQGSVRQLVVSTMKLAIGYWVEDSGTSKVELAKSSELWKVHIDRNGWERARTLDKYLEFQTCPQRPRLGQVINTIYFVLANCSAASEQREQLEASLSRLNRV